MTTFLMLIGCVVAGFTSAAILWSVAVPNRRIWPPLTYHKWTTPIFVWVPTFTLFGVIIALGVSDWGSLGMPNWIRYTVGPIFILLGNLAVWAEVAGFGIEQTGGAKGSLKTDGLYRYSRNPQYVADTVMLIGWAILASSTLALPVIIAAIIVLLTAPFSEEIWLEENYGDEYRSYKRDVRRFL